MKFENYLEEHFAKGYMGTDDEMSEAYESWLAQLDTEEVINHAEAWGLELAKEVRAVVQNEERSNGGG